MGQGGEEEVKDKEEEENKKEEEEKWKGGGNEWGGGGGGGEETVSQGEFHNFICCWLVIHFNQFLICEEQKSSIPFTNSVIVKLDLPLG